MKVGEKEVGEDEEPGRLKPEKVPKLKPVFGTKDGKGTITSANASKLNDGACSILLMSERALNDSGLNPLAEIVAYSDGETNPIDFNLSPQIAA